MNKYISRCWLRLVADDGAGQYESRWLGEIFCFYLSIYFFNRMIYLSTYFLIEWINPQPKPPGLWWFIIVFFLPPRLAMVAGTGQGVELPQPPRARPPPKGSWSGSRWTILEIVFFFIYFSVYFSSHVFIRRNYFCKYFTNFTFFLVCVHTSSSKFSPLSNFDIFQVLMLDDSLTLFQVQVKEKAELVFFLFN